MRFAIAETVANARSRPWLTAGMCLGLIVTIVSVGIVELNSMVDARRDADALVESGYATAFVRRDPDVDPTLSRRDCAELNALPGIVAATWLSESDAELTLWSTDGATVPVRHAGPGIVDVLRAQNRFFASDWSGAALFIDVAGLAAGTPGTRSIRLVDGGAATTVQATSTELQSLGQGFEGWAVAVEPDLDAETDACIVATNLANRSTLIAQLRIAFPPANGFGISWALPNADALEDPIERFADRVTARLWLPAVAACVVMITMYLRLRRSDYAFYRVSGVTGRRLVAIVSADVLLLIAVAVLSAAAVLAALVVTRGPPGFAVRAAISAYGRLTIALTFSSFATAAFVATGIVRRPLALLKDR